MTIVSLLVLAAAVGSASQVIQSGSGSIRDGVRFRYETRVEPLIEGQKVVGFEGGGFTVGDRVHRYLQDHGTRRYVGYDLSVSKRPDGRLVVTLGPLSLTKEKLRLEGNWARIPLQVNSTQQTISQGDEIAVDLFTRAATGQKIVDHLFFDQRPAVLRLPEGSPRDFTIDDVPLTLMNPTIALNGTQVGEPGQAGITGEAVFIYLPGHGRYAMSLAPNVDLGFRKLGEVRGSRLTFRHGNDIISVDCDGPIAPGGGVFHLYVYPDPRWRPSAGAETLQLGGSRARSMVRN